MFWQTCGSSTVIWVVNWQNGPWMLHLLDSSSRELLFIIINHCILLMVLVQNCFFLQDNSKSKTAFPGFMVPACFPHSDVTYSQDSCACLPSFHLPHCELFHAVPGVQICSPSCFSLMQLSWISPSHQRSILYNSPWNMLFSKYTTITCCDGSLRMHRVAEHPPPLGLQGQLLPQAQKIVPGFLVGCSICPLTYFSYQW